MEVSSYTNREDEKISISFVSNTFNKFFGDHLLVIHDDPEVSKTVAPHLLDEGTINYLLTELPKIKETLTKRKKNETSN